MPGKPAIRIPKMTAKDDPEVFLKSLECSSWVAGWPEDQWVAILIPCLMGLAQLAVDTVAPEEVMNNSEIQDAIL